MRPTRAVYLDQCVVSELRAEQRVSNNLREVLCKLDGCIFVYSDIHVREILRSGNPRPYIEALEGIGAYHLPVVDFVEELSARTVTFTSNVVREKIPENVDFNMRTLLALEQIIRLMAPLDIAGRTISLDDQMEIAIAELDAYLEEFEKETKASAPLFLNIEPMIIKLQQHRNSTVAGMRSIDARRIQDEAQKFHEDYSRNLDRHIMGGFAGRELAAYLIENLPESETVKASYPEGFGRGSFPHGQMASFAFLLFSLGAGRFKNPMKGGSERFLRRLTNQFRDCEHIEQAVRCHAFITMDNGAARLARAVYGYAGLENEVILLGIEKN